MKDLKTMLASGRRAVMSELATRANALADKIEPTPEELELLRHPVTRTQHPRLRPSFSNVANVVHPMQTNPEFRKLVKPGSQPGPRHARPLNAKATFASHGALRVWDDGSLRHDRVRKLTRAEKKALKRARHR